MSEIMERHDEEDINFAEALDQSFKKIHKGEKVKGTVAAVNNTEAIVDTGTKYTGYVPLSELTDSTSLMMCAGVDAPAVMPIFSALHRSKV